MSTAKPSTLTAAVPAATPPSLFPFMAYEDAPAALDWLCRAFGFEKHFVVPGPDGTIAHAQLRLGNGLVMCGSAKGRREMFGMGLPRDCGGVVTGGVYVVVDDVDGHYRRARSAGADIVRELADTDYGAREYMARDPEGHVWSFGTYQPFAGEG
jgi:uncharacterized glyoxalase superfamily protein PhnB